MNTTSIATKSIAWETRPFEGRDHGAIRFLFETEEFEIQLAGQIEYTAKREDARTVIYGRGEEEVDFSEAYAYAKTIESGLKRGVDKALDKMFDAGNAQVKRNKRAVIDEAIEKFDFLAELIEGVTLRWSDKAGCSMCPCSPGFRTIPNVYVTLPTEVSWQDEPYMVKYIVNNIWVTKK